MAFLCDRRAISLQRVHQLSTDLPHRSQHHVKVELETLHFSCSLQVLGLFVFLIPVHIFPFWDRRGRHRAQREARTKTTALTRRRGFGLLRWTTFVQYSERGKKEGKVPTDISVLERQRPSPINSSQPFEGCLDFAGELKLKWKRLTLES